MTTFQPHPDRLLPTDPGLREIARNIYQGIRDVPIISPHGHVNAAMIRDDEAFPDPATLLVSGDHYVTRLLHAHGIPLHALGVGSDASPRDIWATVCAHWDVFLGTPVRLWMETELYDVFGITVELSSATANLTFDQISDALARPEFRPRALFRQFGIDVLATTDDPADDLAAHAALAADPSFSGRVLPTFRPDPYIDPALPQWATSLDKLAKVSGQDTGTAAGLLAALRVRREYFIQHGATASDQSAFRLDAAALPASEAERIHQAALRGEASPSELAAYQAELLFRCVEMACDDGLVMQIHGGVLRNHHGPTFRQYGPDTGHDFPTPTQFTVPLRPALEAFGTHPGLHLVLFTVDETTFARDIAPLAGFYPSVFVGAPWWFLDTPAAIGRFRRAVTDSAGFAKTAGFVDDTRAYCSIPARHDMARRCDAAYLATLVGEHLISEEQAARTAHALADELPRRAFKL